VKTKEVQELRDIPAADLQLKHEELVTQYFRLRIKHSLGQLEDPMVLRRTRRDVARAKTLLAERGIAATIRRRHRTAAKAAKGSKDKKDEG
jgi:large subunit ribosomal protein L29